MTAPVALRCACGSEHVVAVAPGTTDEKPSDLFLVARGEPMRAWCADHWPWRTAALAALVAAGQAEAAGEVGRRTYWRNTNQEVSR